MPYSSAPIALRSSTTCIALMAVTPTVTMGSARCRLERCMWAAAVDEHLNVATRVPNHVRERIAVPLVHEQQVLEPVAVDVEMRQRGD